MQIEVQDSAFMLMTHDYKYSLTWKNTLMWTYEH